jgi:NAD(P) transhydrogenase subunit alpha
VALVPELVARLVPGGFEILVERDAGAAASFPDAPYEEAGARIVDDVYGESDAVVKVQKPTEDETGQLHEGQVLIGFLQPLTDPEGVARIAGRGVTAFAMESIPRITRAQPMDALSSQATVSGYKATLLAAERLPKFFPMLMTAAGTVAPAKVLVLGAGVAGLQAIATASPRRRRHRLRRSPRRRGADREPRCQLARPVSSARPPVATRRSSPRRNSGGSRRSSRPACPSSTSSSRPP